MKYVCRPCDFRYVLHTGSAYLPISLKCSQLDTMEDDDIQNVWHNWEE